MNAWLEMVANDSAPAPAAEGLRSAAAAILRSPSFAKAPRMRQLLAFLIDAELTGGARQLNEYAIGLAVFRRDPRVYDTTLDPVVRVQTGRLRERLAAHYRAAGGPGLPEISIPTGGYALRIASPAAVGGMRLQLAPLRDLSPAQGTDVFVAGLDDELGARLYRAFGKAVTLGAGAGAADVRLEGGIRVEGRRVRACMRLVDEHAGQVVWMAQFDGDGDLGMALQEGLAGAIHDGLLHYLRGASVLNC